MALQCNPISGLVQLSMALSAGVGMTLTIKLGSETLVLRFQLHQLLQYPEHTGLEKRVGGYEMAS